MTRRAALRKFGFGAGMAALLALSSDDLARMAAAKLKQHAGDNKVANQVAQEFKNAGLAFAEEEYDSSAFTSTNPCDTGAGHNDCKCISNAKNDCVHSADNINCSGMSQVDCNIIRDNQRGECRKYYLIQCKNFGCTC